MVQSTEVIPSATPLLDACFYINRDGDTERNERFLKNVACVKNWPFLPPRRWPGVVANPPVNYQTGKGSWGCYLSHMEIYHTCIVHGIPSAVIFEDDAVFSPDFGEQVRWFMEKVPNDWNVIYFGGNHYHLPKAISSDVLLGRCCNTTHAYAIRATALSGVHQFLSRFPSTVYSSNFEIDTVLGTMQHLGLLKAYTPWHFFVGQAKGESVRTGDQFDRDMFFDMPPEAYQKLGEQLC